MPISTFRQQASYDVPPTSDARDPAAAPARPAPDARASYDVRCARHRRSAQAALAASVLKLSPRRR